MSRRAPTLIALSLLLAACAPDEDGIDGPPPAEDFRLTASTDSFSHRMEVLGEIRYGEDRGPVRYVYSRDNRYRAYTFQGRAGDEIDIWVKSNIDAVGWLLDARFGILLKSKNVSSTNKDAHLVGTLPADGLYYIAFREYELRSADFTVSLRGPCHPTRTCESEGFECGPLTDDCGNELDCGGCDEPETCGGGGAPHTCGQVDPEDPYGDLTDAELVAKLRQEVTAAHRVLTYDEAKVHLFAVDGLEVIPSGELECQYTAKRIRPTGAKDPEDFNTEHTWPQSRGAGVLPPKGDLHHLFATQENANSRRGNLEFGETRCGESGQAACSWELGGSQLGKNASGSQIFEVRPARRGEVARAIFYMSVRYDWRVRPDEETTLKRWNLEDPPNDWERRRDEMVEGFQGNRNPFIWRPDLIERIADF